MKITGQYSLDHGSRHETLDINLDLTIEECVTLAQDTLSIQVNKEDLDLFKNLAQRLGSVLENRTNRRETII